MVRMKRNKNQDWTRVLQERLQDAQLPAPDDFASWAGQESPAFPARSPKNQGDRPEKSGVFWPVAWWPWALGSVAVAAFAGILFLRTPDHHTRLNPTIPPVVTESPAPIPSESPAVPAESTPAPATPAVIPAAPIVIPAEEPESPAASSKTALGEDRPQKTEVPSSKQASSEDKQQNTEVSSSKQTQNEDEIPGQARNDDKETRNDDRVVPTQSFDDLIVESPARRRKPRLSLRVHAASVSSVKTATTSITPVNGNNAFSDASSSQDAPEFYFGPSANSGLSSSTSENGQLTPANSPNIDTSPIYTANPGTNIMNPVPVPRAPTIPVSFGVSAELSLSRHWSLLAGLDYTQRSGYRVYENAPQSLTLHYLGIPLEAHYIFWPESRFRVYLGAGVKAEKSFLVTGGEPLKDPFLFSVNAQAGADVRLFPGVRLYFSPVFSGYLTRSAYANTWDNRPQFSLRAGLSFDL